MDPTRQVWFERARAHPVEHILEKRGFKLPLGTKNERKGPCPRCGGDDRFGLNVTKQIFTCHQCSLKGAGGIDITMALDSCDARTAAETLEGPPPKSNGHDSSTTKSRRVATWIYRDADGQPYLKVDRLEQPNGKKDYPQSRWEDGKWVSGKPKGPKIPYRLPELLDADRTEPVFIVEGEKCADRLAKEGVAVTSASEGARKWTSDLNQHFADRIVWILPDTDEPGRKHAGEVAANLHGIAREVRIVEISGLNEGQDVFDFLEGGGTGNDLRDLGERVPLWQPPPNGEGISQGPDGLREEPVAPLVWIKMDNWDSEPRPEMEWAVPGRIPLRQAFLLSGEGGGGKSTLLKQLCACHVVEYHWLGSMPAKGPAFFIEAEDLENILHARMYDICLHYKTNFADLIKGGLHMLSRAGEDAVMAAPNRDGRIVPTKFYQQILEQAGDIKPKMIGIASSANVFAGNEVNRSQVMQFAGLLTRLAIAANGSVALASHPSLTGIKEGTGLSGSTQWHNAFRARAYLNFIKPENGEQPDPDLRELQFLKNQYGRRDDTILLRYQDGLFLPPPGPSFLSRGAKEASADEVFLTLLRRFAREKRKVSGSPSVTYAPALFALEKESVQAGFKSKDLAAAMRRLFQAGKILNAPHGRPSRLSYHIAIKEEQPDGRSET